MRKISWIVSMAFWLLPAVSGSRMFVLSAKEAPDPGRPACPANFSDSLERTELPTISIMALHRRKRRLFQKPSFQAVPGKNFERCI